MLKPLVKETVVKYGSFCFDCGRENLEIVEGLFKNGEMTFRKGAVSTIGDNLHKISISRKFSDEFDACVYHKMEGRTPDFFCIDCGKKITNFEKKDEFGSYICNRCGCDFNI